MSDNTGIEWADATWNPVTGCTKVSPGCDHCYAETLAERFRGTPGHYYENGFDVQLRPERLDQPLRWTRPRRIFVNSMSDLFHDDVPDEYVARVFAVMAAAERHTFQLLTKRHGRMRSLLTSRHFRRMVRTAMHDEFDVSEVDAFGTDIFPLFNVWLGVSVEDQKRADLRIPALLETPAAVRFLSCEPLLGPVCLDAFHSGDGHAPGTPMPCEAWPPGIGWVIVGGESGHGARPMHPEWARSLRDQCVAAGIPYLFKQWGEWVPEDQSPEETIVPATYRFDRATRSMRLGKKAAGRELDGRTWDQYPGGAS